MEEKIDITKIKEVLDLTFHRNRDDIRSYEQYIIKIPVSILIIPVNNDSIKEYKDYEYASLTKDNKNIILYKYKYIRVKESECLDLLTGREINGRNY